MPQAVKPTCAHTQSPRWSQAAAQRGDDRDAHLAALHDACFFGSLAAVWHYVRAWAPRRCRLHGRRLDQDSPHHRRPLPYQEHARAAHRRLRAAHAWVAGHPDFLRLPPGRFPVLFSELDDGSLPPASQPLGHALPPGAAADGDVPASTPLIRPDLDACDRACPPHAQRAASAVVQSRDFLRLYSASATTPTGRARMIDGSVPRGPASFWRRVPTMPPPDTASTPVPLFAFARPDDFPAALAIDLLLQPDVPGDGDEVRCMHHCCAALPPILPGHRHFVDCPHGLRSTATCHDPVVATLATFAAGCLGPARVRAERGLGAGGVSAIQQWLDVHPLPHRPDLILTDLDGPGTFTIIDVKTLDAAGPSHIASDHTDRDRLAAHAAAARHWTASYGVLPPRCRLVIFVVGTSGSIGSAGQSLLRALSERCGRMPPHTLSDQVSWSAPRFAPMARMAISMAVRRGLAHAVRESWSRVPRGRPRHGAADSSGSSSPSPSSSSSSSSPPSSPGT